MRSVESAANEKGKDNADQLEEITSGSATETRSQLAQQRRTTFEFKPILDVFAMHVNNPGAMFQAASQFNCLEFPGPSCSPEGMFYCL
jgi:hypothetical protein